MIERDGGQTPCCRQGDGCETLSEVGEIWVLEEEVADGFGDVAATVVWRCFELELVLVNVEEGVSGKNLGYRIGKLHIRDSAARL